MSCSIPSRVRASTSGRERSASRARTFGWMSSAALICMALSLARPGPRCYGSIVPVWRLSGADTISCMTERPNHEPGPPETRGTIAERFVVERLRAVLAPSIAVIPHLRWLARDHGYVREGEADVVIGDPERGILVIEVKAGEIRRDHHGTWWAGLNRLTRTPFEQAGDSRRALVRKLSELPDWPAGLDPIAGQAVAFPDVELDTMRHRLGLLGPDVDTGLIADQSMFVDTEAGRSELTAFVDRAFELWSGSANTKPPGKV